ncbi:putative glucokinase [Mycobacterium xenopi 3993]|nr:putative glucokinase [Mycobacterium xenopi 3993]
MPVRLAGDGLCMAVGEHRYGAGAARASCSASWCPPASAVVSCWTAAGTAGAPATPDTSAMWSWTPAVSRAPAAARLCRDPGRRTALVRWARVNGWDAPPGVSAKELADAAVDGNPVAVQAFRHGAEALAATIASVAAVCDLDRVVVGGGVANAGPLLFDPLRAALASTPAWPTSAACGCCPPSSATMPG